MNDSDDERRIRQLEAELAALGPRALAPELAEQIASRLSERPATRSDRFLIATMSAGSIAAAVIVAVLLVESQNAPRNAPGATDVTAMAQHRGGGETPLAFARAVDDNRPW
jgi:hypothetical protein